MQSKGRLCHAAIAVQLDVDYIGDAAATKRFEGAHGHLGDVGFGLGGHCNEASTKE